MALVLDIGNTHTRCAEWDGNVFRSVVVVPSGELTPALLDRSAGPFWAASVNPAAAAKLGGRPVRFVSAARCGGRLDFSRMDASTLGADRIANAVALTEFFPLPSLVVDCGTAITLEAVDEKRRFLGGAIAPGRALMRRALAGGTAQLAPFVESGCAPEHLGRNSADAIALGVDRGAIGLLRELLNAATAECPFRALVVTGGDAAFFAAALSELTPAPPNFTLHGIRLALEREA